MSQSVQAVEQDEQAVGQIIKENVVTQGLLLGSSQVRFDFEPSKFSPRTAKVSFTPPPGMQGDPHIVLQEFNVEYTDTDFELQILQVALKIEGTTAICTATLRDKNGGPNKAGQQWTGTVLGLVLFFGTPPPPA
jgi:hypothetical protein